MNWKKFLKPDWRKIVVFVIIFTLICLGFLNSYFCPHIMGGPLIIEKNSRILYDSFCSSTNFLGAFVTYLYNLNSFSNIINLSISIIVSLIILYIISCLIVWIYDKFRKVKKK